VAEVKRDRPYKNRDRSEPELEQNIFTEPQKFPGNDLKLDIFK
jgi:hypothetical protein